MNEGLSDEQKKFFADAAARRKETGIRLGRFTVMMNSVSAGVMNDYWEEWVTLLGKDAAVKLLLDCMMKWTEGLREAKRLQDRKKGRR